MLFILREKNTASEILTPIKEKKKKEIFAGNAQSIQKEINLDSSMKAKSFSTVKTSPGRGGVRVPKREQDQ